MTTRNYLLGALFGFAALLALLCAAACPAHAQNPYVNVTGVLEGPNGLPAANSIISLTPTQQFVVPGTGSTVCAYDYFIQINTTPLAPCDTLDFNSTTPAAPGGYSNVIFQTTKVGTTDFISGYVVGGVFGCVGVNPGDVCYYNGTAWTILTGNSAIPALGTVTALTETSSGVPSWQGVWLGSGKVCETGLGDGVNAIPANSGTPYLQLFCLNYYGVTVTITAIFCYTDNAGTSTLNAKNNAGTSLLTGPITCNNTKAFGGQAGTLSSAVTLVSGDGVNFSFVSDGTSTQTTWSVIMTTGTP